MVTRAVILAAGQGTRLGELTAATPKPLLELGGRPLIDRIAAGIAATGITELVVITGYLASQLERHLAATAPIPVSFVRQAERNGTAGALLLAAAPLGFEPFMLSWADIATAPEHFAAVAAAWRPELAGAIGVNRVDDPRELSAVMFGPDRRIQGIVEKPEGEPPSRWNSSGIMVFGPHIWSHLGAVGPSARNELELPDAINSMIETDEVIEAVPLTGPWFDVGTPQGLEAAREAFAAR